MESQTTAPKKSPRTVLSGWLSMPGFQRYGKNIGWNLMAKIASLAVSFFVTAYVVRSLGPTDYGYLSYAVSYVSIFSFIASVGIDQVLYRELIRFPDKVNEFMGTAFVIRLVAGMIGTGLSIATAYTLSRGDISFFLICIISFTFVFNAVQLINYEFQARVETKYLAFTSMITLVILNAMKVLAIYFGRGIIYLAIILLLEAVLNAGFLVYYRVRRYGPVTNWKYDSRVAMLLMTDAWPMIFAGAFSVIYARIDQVFIKNLINTASVGFYDAAVRLSEVWYFVPTIIIGIFFPALLNARSVSREAYTKRLAQSALLLAGLATAVSLPVTIFASWIIYIVYGAGFAASAPVLQIYVWSGVATALGGLATSYLIAENLRKILFISSCSTMLINIVLNMLLIPHYGIIGSAWATFFSYMAVPLSLLLFRVPRAQIISMFRIKNVFHS